MDKQQLIKAIKNDGCVTSISTLNSLPTESLEFIIELREWTKERQQAN